MSDSESLMASFQNQTTADVQLTPDGVTTAKILDYLRKQSGSHNQIKAALGLDALVYDAAKAVLLHQNAVVLMRCRGGGLRMRIDDQLPQVDAKAIEIAAQMPPAPVITAADEKLERDLYPYLQQWANNAGYGTVKIIGDQHRRDSWENPDLIALDTYDFDWLVGHEIEVTTVEAKLGFDIYGIWQAAHYRRFSHYVYLACMGWPDVIRSQNDGRLFDLAVELGLGIIVMRTAGAGGKGITCIEINSPARQQPMARELDRLLGDYAGMLNLKRPGRRIAEQMGELS